MTIALVYFMCGMYSMWQPVSNPAQQFRLIDQHRVRETGGATHSFEVDDSTILTVDSKMQLNLWRFSDTSKLGRIATHDVGWSSWNFAYSRRNKVIAYPAQRNNGIHFYKISDDGSFQLAKFLDWSSVCPKGPTLTLAFSPDGRSFAFSACHSKSIEILDSSEYKSKHSLPHKEYVDWLAFLSDDLLLSISDTDVLRVWRLSGKNPVMIVECNLPKDGWEILDVGYSHEQQRLVAWYGLPGCFVGYTEITLTRADAVKHGKLKLQAPNGILVFRVSPDLDYLVIGTTKSEVTIVSCRDFEESAAVALQGRPASVLFLNKGNRFLVGCLNGNIALFSRVGLLK